eukprot:g4030.t1
MRAIPAASSAVDVKSVFLLLDFGNSDVYSAKALYRYLRLSLPCAGVQMCAALRYDSLLLVAALVGRDALFLQVILTNLYTFALLIPQGVSLFLSLSIGEFLGSSRPDLAAELANVGPAFCLTLSGISLFLVVAVSQLFALIAWWAAAGAAEEGQTLPPLQDGLTFGVEGLLSFYSAPQIDVSIVRVVITAMAVGWLLESFALAASGVVRACAFWRTGLYVYVVQLVNLPLAYVLCEAQRVFASAPADADAGATGTSGGGGPTASLVGVWGVTVCLSVFGVYQFRAKARSIDFVQRSSAALQRLRKEYWRI